MAPIEEMRWYFEPVGPMGGATGGAFRNVLQGSGLPAEVELAREAIQNSCDAAAGEQPVRVVFRIEELDQQRAQQFVQDLQLDALRPRLNALKLQDGKSVNHTSQLQLTYVEDYETVGLSGDPHRRDSHFFRLLLELGDTEKTAKSGTGGSYGYGKAALSIPSRLRLIVAYTAFSSAGDGALVHRLMGCAFFDPHSFEGQDWTGRAWFAVPCHHGQTGAYDPLEGTDAERMADLLGFSPRKGREERGTSILIVDSQVDCETLLRGIEEWWWPRIVDQTLQVEVQVGGDKKHPKPRSNRDLAAFVECYDLALGRAEPTGNHQRSGKFNPHNGIPLGRYAFAHLAPGDELKLGEEWLDRWGARVALIRAPRMVVQYLLPLPRNHRPAVGVFVADPEIDDALRQSEPPNHDRWDKESRRLTDEQRSIVHTVLSRIRREFQKFLKDTQPPVPPNAQPLPILQRELARWLHLPLKRGKGGGHPGDPIEIRWEREPHATAKGTRLRSEGRLALRIREDGEYDEVNAKVVVEAHILERDEQAPSGDQIDVTIREEGSGPAASGSVTTRLLKGEWKRYHVETTEYEPTWSIDLRVKVESIRGR